ncbi:MAG: hypothetical protein ACO1O1_07030 [Adhaeribacter sp.]
MTQYQAKLLNSLTFEVTKEDELVGKLTYESWFKFNALIEIANNSTYQVEPKGFWGTTIQVKDGEKVVLEFSMNWNGEIILQSYFAGLEKDYIFKHKGIFKESYLLIDRDGVEQLVMKPDLKWKKMDYEYQVTTSETFEALSNKEILLMASLHCANYYMSLMMAQ